jgi:hypothetical protein
LVDCVYGIIQLVQSYGCKTRGWNTVCLCIEFYSNPANPVIGAGFSGLRGFPGLGLDVFVINCYADYYKAPDGTSVVGGKITSITCTACSGEMAYSGENALWPKDEKHCCGDDSDEHYAFVCSKVSVSDVERKCCYYVTCMKAGAFWRV